MLDPDDNDDNGDNDDNYDDDDTGGHMEQCVRACRTLVSRCSARFMQSYYLLGLHSLIMMIIIHMMMMIITIILMMMMMLTVITLWDTCQGLDLCKAITFSAFILLIMMIILVTLLLNNDNDDNSRNNDNNNDDDSRNTIVEQQVVNCNDHENCEIWTMTILRNTCTLHFNIYEVK